MEADGYAVGSDSSIEYTDSGISANEVKESVTRMNARRNTSSGSKWNSGKSTDTFESEDEINVVRSIETSILASSIESTMSASERIEKYISGLFRGGIATIAITAGLAVATGGMSLIPTLIGAGTVAAGVGTGIFGLAEFSEGTTGGYNFLRDDLFNGDELAYAYTDAGFMIGATAGAAYCATISVVGDKNKVAEGQAADSQANEGAGKNAFKSQKLLDSHYTKHASEFGNITKDQYLKGAQNLTNSNRGGNILAKTRPNGDALFYNKVTNEFAVKASDGTIRTYFKPTDGINYFNRQ